MQLCRHNSSIAVAQDYYPGACPDGTIGRMLMPNRVYSDTNQTQMLVRAITQYAHVSEIDTFTVDTAGWTGTSGGAVSQANKQLVVTADHENEATLRSYTTQASQKYQLLLDLDHGDCDSLKVEILDSASIVIASYNNVSTSLSYNFTAVNSTTKVKVSRQDKNGQNINAFYLNSAILSEIRDTLYQDTIYTATGNGYRFAFNGMERDDQWNGVGNSYDFGARIYDPRLGRWLAVDAFVSEYPDYSPYNYVLNSPIIFIDPDGNKVKVKDLVARKALLNTLSADELRYVRIKKSGKVVIDKDAPLGGVNFEVLKVMTGDKKKFIVEYSDEYKSVDGPVTLPDRSSGRTVAPNVDLPKNLVSANKKVYVLIATKNLDELGQAEILTHELYGHGYLYLQSLLDERVEWTHHYEPGTTIEENLTLRWWNWQFMKETRTNYEIQHVDVEEQLNDFLEDLSMMSTR